jgi:hypothetical protein
MQFATLLRFAAINHDFHRQPNRNTGNYFEQRDIFSQYKPLLLICCRDAVTMPESDGVQIGGCYSGSGDIK